MIFCYSEMKFWGLGVWGFFLRSRFKFKPNILHDFDPLKLISKYQVWIELENCDTAFPLACDTIIRSTHLVPLSKYVYIAL